MQRLAGAAAAEQQRGGQKGNRGGGAGFRNDLRRRVGHGAQFQHARHWRRARTQFHIRLRAMRDADLVLQVNDAELQGFRSLTSAMCLAQTLAMGLALTAPAFAQTVLFGPKQYTRTAGPPNQFTDTFTLTYTVTNGFTTTVNTTTVTLPPSGSTPITVNVTIPPSATGRSRRAGP